MIAVLVEIGLAFLFGTGFTLALLGLNLFYKIFWDANDFRSTALITSIAFFFLSLGVSSMYFVIM